MSLFSQFFYRMLRFISIIPNRHTKFMMHIFKIKIEELKQRQ